MERTVIAAATCVILLPDASSAQQALEFRSMSGTIELVLPSQADARLRMATMGGELHSDFPIEMQGRFSSRRLEGTIGAGGQLIDVGTMDGSIRVRRGR